jgi:hypothetical protein
MFGRPSSVEEQPGLDTVITKLSSLLSRTGSHTAFQPKVASPIRSQAGSFEGRGSQLPQNSNSSTPFATQVPDDINGYGNRTDAGPKLRPSTGQNELLSLLLDVQNQKEHSILENETGESSVLQPERTINSIRNSSVVRTIEESTVEISSQLGMMANKQESQLPLLSQQSHCDDAKEQPTFDRSLNSPIYPAVTTPLSGDNEKESSQESNSREMTQKENSIVPEVAQVTPAVEHVNHAVPVFVMDQIPEQNPFEGLKRVPRSYVRVPASQLTILERKDSWFQGGNSSRSPHAHNLPQEVLQDLNIVVDQIVTQGDDGSNQTEGLETKSDLRRYQNHESNNGVREDTEAMEVEQDEFDQASDTDNSGKGRENNQRLGRTSVSPSRIVRQETDQGTDTQTKGTRRQLSVGPGLDTGTDKINDLVDHDDDETSEQRSIVSWSQSPGRTPRPCSLPVPENSRPHSPSSSTGGEMDVDELPGIHHTDASTMTLHLNLSHQTIDQSRSAGNYDKAAILQKHSYPSFPSSSLAGESEIEMGVLHAIDDQVDESDEEMNSPSTSQKLPSTAIQNCSVIQVEQTPHPNQRGPEESGDKRVPHIGQKRPHGEISSDSVIPGTFDDQSPQDRVRIWNKDEVKSLDTTSGKAPLTADSTRHFPSNHVSIDNDDAQVEDVMASRSLFSELDNSQRDAGRAMSSSPVMSPPALQRMPKKLKIASSERHQTADLEQPSSPNLPFRAGDGESEVELASTGKTSPQDPQLWKRDTGAHQRVLKPRRFINTTAPKFSQEEYGTPIDTDEMVRASRRAFNAQLSMEEAEEPRLPVGNGTFTSITLEQDSGTAADCTPPDISETVTRRPTPDTPAVLQFTTRIVMESPLRNTTESQKDSERHDTHAGIQQSISMVTQSNRNFPVPLVRKEPSIPSTAFEKFKSAYPTYKGSEKRFIEALTYIEWLVEGKGRNFLRKSHWDDLIRVLADEHLEYIRDARNRGIPMKEMHSGFEYYNEIDQDPIFKKRVITPDNLQMSLASLNAHKVAEARSIFNGKPKGSEMQSTASTARSHHHPDENVVETPSRADGDSSVGMIGTSPELGASNDAESIFKSKPKESGVQLTASAARTQHHLDENVVETPSRAYGDSSVGMIGMSPELGVSNNAESRTLKRQYFETHRASTVRIQHPDENVVETPSRGDGDSSVGMIGMSPELGASNNAEGRTLKRPYFETHSQVEATKQKQAPSATPGSDSQADHRLRRRRHLPFSPASNSYVSSASDEQLLRSPIRRLQSQEKAARSVARPDIRTRSLDLSARHYDVFKSPSLPDSIGPRSTSKIASRSTNSLPHAHDRGLRRMTLHGQIPASKRDNFFREFGRRKRESGLWSNPASTDTTYFSIKSVKDTPVAEPET